MIIAINLAHLTGELNKNLFFQYFERFAATRFNDQFIFIVHKNYATPAILPFNILIEKSGPNPNIILLFRLWYAHTLPAMLKKHHAEVIINAGGACSLRTKIKQVVFVNEWYIATGSPSFTGKQVRFLKRKALVFLNKASVIVAGSQFQKKQLVTHYKIAEEKIEVLQLGVSELYQPLAFADKEKIKETWSGGKEYFLFRGVINHTNNLVNLLKAFSFFKVRQKSNMQLLVLANCITTKNSFADSLKTYKYRNEVELITDLSDSEISSIIAAAYAFVYPVPEETFPIFPVCALQSEVPLILSNTGTFKETAGDAALYVDADNFQDIAAKMMLLFKDENERNKLIENGKLLILLNRNEESYNALWQIIASTITINSID